MRYIVATHNAHKLSEIARILRPLGIDAVTDRQIGLSLPEVEETGDTFEENAYLKAASACAVSGLPAIADDSGLMIDALDGAPGVYSARYAGEGATDAQRIAKVLAEMRDVPPERRTARFVSAVCCVFPNGERVTARGTCEGTIGYVSRGEGGFGYDPIFVTPDGPTFAELTGEQKDAVSHRGNSLRVFSEKLRTYLEEQRHDQ
ncbi:MAG: RdgB/HAM1 family non-canonical purine NTP pyrophosphatase [Acutalibacteraceae bacterium]|jgi:XTP/dITP diphosphohydrolase